MGEIICDIDMNGPTHHVISKTENGLYRICYEPDNLDETMLKLRHEGFLLMQYSKSGTIGTGSHEADDGKT